MATGYTSRMLSAGVSRHTVAPYVEPELRAAEFASRVYRQRWVSRSAHGRGSALEFDVLALDDDHARAVGERWIERQFGAGTLGDVVLTSNVSEAEWRLESIAACMAIEDPLDREERRYLYAESQAQG